MASPKKNTATARQATSAPPGPLTERVLTRVDVATKAWLDDLAAAAGMKDSDLVRRIVDHARRTGWDPASAMRSIGVIVRSSPLRCAPRG